MAADVSSTQDAEIDGEGREPWTPEIVIFRFQISNTFTDSQLRRITSRHTHWPTWVHTTDSKLHVNPSRKRIATLRFLLGYNISNPPPPAQIMLVLQHETLRNASVARTNLRKWSLPPADEPTWSSHEESLFFLSWPAALPVHLQGWPHLYPALAPLVTQKKNRCVKLGCEKISAVRHETPDESEHLKATSL